MTVQQHVWHQGRKVTPFAGAAYTGYGRYRYRTWVNPQEQHKRWKSAMQSRWHMGYAPRTIGASAGPVLTVAGSHVGWFRLVDKHGKPYGRRLQRLGPTRDSSHWYQRWDYLCADHHGHEQWLDGATRVRYVAQQTEDYHSYASRVLTRAHKAED